VVGSDGCRPDGRQLSATTEVDAKVDRIGSKAGAGALMAMVLLGLVACGDDGDGDEQGGAGNGILDEAASEGGAPASGSDIDACALLEASEIGELFGERGTVADGEPNQSGPTSLCSWGVGDPAAPEGGTVTLGVSPDVTDAIFEELTGDPVEGLGDEALISGETLHVQSGDLYFNIIAAFYPTLAGTSEKLTSLGEAVAGRL
jgi:hypothetical protein